MANKKQRRERDRRVRQQQAELRGSQSQQGLSEREYIKASKQGELYEDYGEDGKPMTKARTRLQRVLSGYTIWGFICIPIAVCWFMLSCFPDQEWAVFSFLGYRDYTVNGWDPTVVLRIEAVVTLLGLLALMVNSFTFSWMFGQATAVWYRAITIVLAVAYAGYLAFCISSYGLIEPVSIVNLVFILFIWYSARQVANELVSY